MIAAMDRVLRHVDEKVVHPAHVPFQPEAEAAEVGGARYAGPRGAFLGDSHDSREAIVANFVEALEEIDGLEIFAPAKAIGNPLAGFARVIEIKHRGYRIHAQAIDV